MLRHVERSQPPVSLPHIDKIPGIKSILPLPSVFGRQRILSFSYCIEKNFRSIPRCIPRTRYADVYLRTAKTNQVHCDAQLIYVRSVIPVYIATEKSSATPSQNRVYTHTYAHAHTTYARMHTCSNVCPPRRTHTCTELYSAPQCRFF